MGREILQVLSILKSCIGWFFYMAALISKIIPVVRIFSLSAIYPRMTGFLI